EALTDSDRPFPESDRAFTESDRALIGTVPRLREPIGPLTASARPLTGPERRSPGPPSRPLAGLERSSGPRTPLDLLRGSERPWHMPPVMGSPAPSSAALPRQFGRYLLFDRIGRGGMADIYLAQVKTELGVPRRVVVKEILPELSGDAHFARMLVDEAKLVAGLRHANVAQVLDLGREDGRLFIAMEYVEGLDLNQLLRRLSKSKIALP